MDKKDILRNEEEDCVLMPGVDFAALMPEGCEKVEFLHGEPEGDIEFGKNIMGKYENQTLTIKSMKPIYANENSSYMFYKKIILKEINFDNFDTSRVENMRYMFDNCEELKELDLSKFDTSNVEHMNNMFNHCKRLETLDLSKFNTHNVVSMEGMFENCSELKRLNISGWKTDSLLHKHHMFLNCDKLDLSDPVFDKLK